MQSGKNILPCILFTPYLHKYTILIITDKDTNNYSILFKEPVNYINYSPIIKHVISCFYAAFCIGLNIELMDEDDILIYDDIIIFIKNISFDENSEDNLINMMVNFISCSVLCSVQNDKVLNRIDTSGYLSRYRKMSKRPKWNKMKKLIDYKYIEQRVEEVKEIYNKNSVKFLLEDIKIFESGICVL